MENSISCGCSHNGRYEPSAASAESLSLAHVSYISYASVSQKINIMIMGALLQSPLVNSTKVRDFMSSLSSQLDNVLTSFGLCQHCPHLNPTFLSLQYDLEYGDKLSASSPFEGNI